MAFHGPKHQKVGLSDLKKLLFSTTAPNSGIHFSYCGFEPVIELHVSFHKNALLKSYLVFYRVSKPQPTSGTVQAAGLRPLFI